MDMKKYYRMGLMMILMLAGILVFGNTAEAKSNSGIISQNKAKSIARKHSKQKKKSVTYRSIKLEKDNSILIYDVEFYTAKRKYEYDIQASNGKIMGYSVELRKTPRSSGTAKISKSKVKKIVLKKAGVKAKNATFSKLKLDREDGLLIYEIKFHTSVKKYEYELQASNGKIISYSMERRNKSKIKDKTMISESQAKKIALAKVPGASEQHISIHLEIDDDEVKYEGTIRYNYVEYDFEIDAFTGKIIEWDVD